MKIRLSYSSNQSLNSCPRKFQLNKLLTVETPREASPSTVFGSAYGIAVQDYLLNKDKEKALFEAWKSYYPVLEDDRKHQAALYSLLENSFMPLDTLLEEWEVAIFEGKPALELSFSLTNLSEVHDIYYVGYLDAVLHNKFTDRYAAIDVKTTGLNLLDLDPIYKNSEQVLGYSIILDKITGKEKATYDTTYLVGQLPNYRNPMESKFLVNTYTKTFQDRLKWLISLALDVKNLETMIEMDHFPMRGNVCFAYRKACYHFGTCSLSSNDEYIEDFVDDINYQFVIDFPSLLGEYLERNN